jgi:DNA (cytosine-5)-methyltransferase 1
MGRQAPPAHLITENQARYYPPLGPQSRPVADNRLQLSSGSSSPWQWRRPIFDFIDLFAGIGGFRIGFEQAGGRCVFSSEWDAQAQRAYTENFGEAPHGDIRKTHGLIPAHDVLVAGFPCQPFSIAGVSKKNALGRSHGFKDEEQGNLFFEIVKVLAARRPEAFVLENVKNLRSHDGGRTYHTIIDTLQHLGYHVFDKIMDAQAFVPQHRERIFIVGFRDFTPFDFPAVVSSGRKLSSILERPVPEKYFLTKHLWEYLQRYAEKHRAKGNGFGCTVTPKNGIARTLSARYYKDGSEILVDDGREIPRRLTPRECANLMGFPSEFKIVCADTQAYKQFGNAVVVPVAAAVAKAVVEALGCEGRQRKGKPKQAIQVRDSAVALTS